jgi:hypothetical protein
MSKISGSGSGIRDEQPRLYFRELKNIFFLVKILKFVDMNPGLGWKKFGSGINITSLACFRQAQLYAY